MFLVVYSRIKIKNIKQLKTMYIIKQIYSLLALLAIFILLVFLVGQIAFAQVENPQSEGIGLQGKISAPPPTTAPTISAPGSGQVISSIPLQVSGVCSTGLLVKLFKNNVFSGSDKCVNGSYSITTDLFSGNNELVARHYDELDQAGPDSNIVSVRLNDAANSVNIVERITLTSVYATKGSDPGKELGWPIIISGGKGPYAVSVDWADGTGADVYSLPGAGEFIIKHTFKQAGVYRVIVKATDSKGTVGYLQIIAIANGEISENQVAGAVAQAANTKTIWVWQPLLIMVPLIITTFYLGKKYTITRIRHKLAKGEHPF